ncbi:hypothetical protein OIE68_13295 [Nocardia vinacea]|uniref:hypothetical protein n=1 Tax=Nocardia vinacea TaxID=96468 RepID=UPI002E10CE8C|nr:hypothetical protein OIE68_13295 [Nocardia vinacea]
MSDPGRPPHARFGGTRRVRVTAPTTKTDIDLGALLRRMDTPEGALSQEQGLKLLANRRRLSLTVAFVYVVLLAASAILTPLRGIDYLGLPLRTLLMCAEVFVATLGCVRWFRVASDRIDDAWLFTKDTDR